MANLLQSSQLVSTNAPSYYTNYLSNLANAGTAAGTNAQYVGAQPLQQQAFQDVTGAASAYQPTLTAAGNTLNSATNATSPLAAASPYLSQATTNPAAEANQYLSSYLMPAAQSLSDINQNNINMNLNPSVLAAATGSGQFGSSRANQAIGQADVLANQQTNSQIANLLNTGYQNALNSAIQQNQVANQAGSTAASAAGTGQSNLTTAGQAQGNLAAQNQNLGLSDINALSTLGQQQQTIAQNQQLFPLDTLSKVAGLLQGQTVPTSTETTMNASPLSGAAAVASGVQGLFSPITTGTGADKVTTNLASQLVGSNISSLSGLVKALNPFASTPQPASPSNPAAPDTVIPTTDAATAAANNGYIYDPASGTYIDPNTNSAFSWNPDKNSFDPEG